MPPEVEATMTNAAAPSPTIKGRPILTSAPPPWHSVTFIACVSVLGGILLPSWSDLDQVATVETFTERTFENIISVRQLAIIRWIIAAQIWTCSFWTYYFSGGWTQITAYKPGSKLHSVPNELVGLKTMFPFTSVSWNFLGLAFSLTGWIAWKASEEQPSDTEDPSQTTTTVSPYVLRAALICWEIAAPFTLLVAAVIRYAIWPAVLKSGNLTDNLKTWRNVYMHNLNVLFATSELALLGGLPVLWSHVSLGTLVGCSYVVFTWCMMHSWNDTAKVGPQTIYFFFDPTIPGYTPTIALAVLLFVMMIFYAIFVCAESVLAHLDGGIPMHLMFVSVLCSCCMRFRD